MTANFREILRDLGGVGPWAILIVMAITFSIVMTSKSADMRFIRQEFHNATQQIREEIRSRDGSSAGHKEVQQSVEINEIPAMYSNELYLQRWAIHNLPNRPEGGWARAKLQEDNSIVLIWETEPLNRNGD